MKESVRNLNIPDSTEPNNLLQLAGDTLNVLEYEQSLALIFKKIFNYCERKYIVINMGKTKYMHLNDNPSLQDLKVYQTSLPAVNPTHGYNWLGYNLIYCSSIQGLIKNHLQKKKVNIGKFYAWLQINENTLLNLKMKTLYNCMFPSFLYSCEAWGTLDNLMKEPLLIERKDLKA